MAYGNFLRQRWLRAKRRGSLPVIAGTSFGPRPEPFSAALLWGHLREQ